MNWIFKADRASNFSREIITIAISSVIKMKTQSSFGVSRSNYTFYNEVSRRERRWLTRRRRVSSISFQWKRQRNDKTGFSGPTQIVSHEMIRRNWSMASSLDQVKMIANDRESFVVFDAWSTPKHHFYFPPPLWHGGFWTKSITQPELCSCYDEVVIRLGIYLFNSCFFGKFSSTINNK